MVKIQYKGNTGNVYADGKLIANDYYYGKPMLIDANVIGNQSNSSKILFQVVPFKSDASVYLQNQAKPFKGINLSAMEVLPVYEAVIK